MACAPIDALPGEYRCRIGDYDLAEAILLNGAARAARDAPDRLRYAEDQAPPRPPRDLARRVALTRSCHSGARPQAESPEPMNTGLWNMGSGLAAARRPGMDELWLDPGRQPDRQPRAGLYGPEIRS